MFATLPRGKDENVRERERETVTGIVCCSKYCYGSDGKDP
jgi:hypothetical protein